MDDDRRGSTFTNARTLFSHSHVRFRLALTPCGLRARGKSVESRTRTVSSRNSHSRISPNALGESEQRTFQGQRHLLLCKNIAQTEVQPN